jgi:hypothetical protein
MKRNIAFILLSAFSATTGLAQKQQNNLFPAIPTGQVGIFTPEEQNRSIQITREKAENIPAIKNQLKKTDSNAVTLHNIGFDSLRLLVNLANVISEANIRKKASIQEQVKTEIVLTGILDETKIKPDDFNILVQGAKTLQLHVIASALKKLKQQSINYLIKTTRAYILQNKKYIPFIINAAARKPASIKSLFQDMPKDFKQKAFSVKSA